MFPQLNKLYTSSQYSEKMVKNTAFVQFEHILFAPFTVYLMVYKKEWKQKEVREL